jgi:hypothetical protein
MSPIEEERCRRAVRAALREFGHGIPAAEWLGRRSQTFAGRPPLLVARDSDLGLDRVLVAIELRRAGRDDRLVSDSG